MTLDTRRDDSSSPITKPPRHRRRWLAALLLLSGLAVGGWLLQSWLRQRHFDAVAELVRQLGGSVQTSRAYSAWEHKLAGLLGISIDRLPGHDVAHVRLNGARLTAARPAT